MVGHILDEDTPYIGVRAAVTGHLVLSTLHTNDCVSAVYRLQNMGIPFYMIAAATTGVVAQRLVKVLCPHCRRKIKAGQQTKRLLYEVSGNPVPLLQPLQGLSGGHPFRMFHAGRIAEIVQISVFGGLNHRDMATHVGRLSGRGPSSAYVRCGRNGVFRHIYVKTITF